MTGRLARVMRPLVTALLAAVVLWGVGAGIAGGDGTNRVRDITSRLRCPVCQGESVADSPSQNAQSITRLVEQQVAAGWSSPQIEQYFVDRYGAWILLDPPRSGTTLWLWAAPLVAVTVGVMAMVSRLDAGRRERRWLLVASGALGAVSLTLLVVLGAAERDARAGDVAAPAGALSADSVPVASRELAEVTDAEMESVIAQNPTVVGMRLALAERYLRAGSVERALVHTSVAVDLPATDQEYERALRLHGWTTALNGAPASGAEYLRAALALSPEDRDAMWFLANVQWTGLGDAGAAMEIIDRLRTTEMTDAQRAEIDGLATHIASATGVGGVSRPTETETETETP